MNDRCVCCLYLFVVGLVLLQEVYFCGVVSQLVCASSNVRSGEGGQPASFLLLVSSALHAACVCSSSGGDQPLPHLQALWLCSRVVHSGVEGLGVDAVV